MKFTKGMHIDAEVILIDDILYHTDPKYYNDSGIRHIYKFLDHDDNVFTWFTSKVIGMDMVNDKGQELWKFINEGDIISISGTVKDVTNYKGEDQIVITRCNVKALVKEAMLTEEKLETIKRTIQLAKYDKKSISYEIKKVPYKDYKNNYSDYEVLVGSFERTDRGCFVDVIVA